MLLALLGCGLLAAVLWAYAGHFHNEFHFDDSHTIQSNVYITDLRNVPRFFTDATTFSSLPSNQSYRPVVTTLNAFDYWLGDALHPFWFHVDIFAGYVLMIGLLYLVFLWIVRRTVAHRWSAFFALGLTAAYALHTVNAETINYVISRSDSSSTLMVVAALAIFQRASGATRYLALLPFAVGMLTKPTALALVPILGLHVLFYETRPGGWGSLSAGTVRTNLRPFVPVGVFALVGAALFLLIERMTPDTWVPGGASRTRYLLTQPFVIASYAWTWLLPFDLSADTDWGTVGSWADWRVGAGALFLSGVGYVFCRAATVRRTFPIAFGIGWYLVALAPTSSIFALAEVKNDHRVFFPNIGLTLAVGWGIVLLVIANEARILRSRSWRLALPLILLAFLGAHTLGVRERSRVWATEESLWHDVVQKSPGNGRGLMNYGLTQMRQGRYDAAREYFEKALVLLPGYSVLQVNLAIVKNAMGETAGVESHFRRALDLDPGSPGSYYFYASWLRERERYGEAAALLRRALDLAPADTASRRLLMDVLADTGEVESLERLARETLETSRHDTKATRYLELLAAGDLEPPPRHLARHEAAAELLAESFERYRAGDHAGCIEASEMALALRADYAPAYNNICAAYNALGQWDAGAASCSRALEIDPGFTLARNNLAWAMAEQGRAAEKSTPEPPATLARY